MVLRKLRKKTPVAQVAPDAVDPPAKAAAAPRPEDATSWLMADLVMRGGTLLLNKGIERGFPRSSQGKGQAVKAPKSLNFGQKLMHGAIVRLATRSVPGAILVGGGLLAKTLHDRRKARAAGEQAPEQATDGDGSREEA